MEIFTIALVVIAVIVIISVFSKTGKSDTDYITDENHKSENEYLDIEEVEINPVKIYGNFTYDNKTKKYSDEWKNKMIDYIVREGRKMPVFGGRTSDLSFEADDGEIDSMFAEAARIVVNSGHGSTSLLQRKLKLGYNRAGRIMDQLELIGIVGPFLGDKPREVLVNDFETLEIYLLEHDLIFDISNMEEFINENAEEIKRRKIEFDKNYEEAMDKHSEHLQNLKDKMEKLAIKAKLLQKEHKRKLHQEALNELIEEGHIFIKRDINENNREPIPREVMNQVWNRDGGKCVQCGCQENLEFDHIIPFSRGGATTYRNLQLLCMRCNREKSNNI